ncbi:dihydrofolate reductase [Candidatus Saccharibacteria bacterium]|nr:MAG: dihydrofolate reductase [Candidatus Saccharibacteria bacterium]
MIAMVVAMAENGVIGSRSDLPWYLPADLRHFKKLTTGKTVVMGRTTFQSIVARLGRPLPQRRNVVLTRDQSFHYRGVETIHDVSSIAPLADDVYVIGGAQVYAAALELADVLYVTEVHAVIDGDAHFPAIDAARWREVSRVRHAADAKNQYDYDFVVYERRHP